MFRSNVQWIGISLIILFSCEERCDNITCPSSTVCIDGECTCKAQIIGEPCKNDACTFKNCLYGGSCDEGTCMCLPPYVGESCEKSFGDVLPGTWVLRNENGELLHYMHISSTSTEGEFLFENIVNQLGQFIGKIDSRNLLVVPKTNTFHYRCSDSLQIEVTRAGLENGFDQLVLHLTETFTSCALSENDSIVENKLLFNKVQVGLCEHMFLSGICNPSVGQAIGGSYQFQGDSSLVGAHSLLLQAVANPGKVKVSNLFGSGTGLIMDIRFNQLILSEPYPNLNIGTNKVESEKLIGKIEEDGRGLRFLGLAKTLKGKNFLVDVYYAF